MDGYWLGLGMGIDKGWVGSGLVSKGWGLSVRVGSGLDGGDMLGLGDVVGWVNKWLCRGLVGRMGKASGYCYLTGCCYLNWNSYLATAHLEIDSINERG